MAVRDDFTAGEVLAAADLNDTFASKLPYSYGTATPSTTDSGFLWYDSNSSPAAPKFWDGSAFQALTSGKILQVVRATDGTDRSTTSTTYVDATGMSVTITPTKSDSAVLVVLFADWYCEWITGDVGFTQIRITDSSNNALSGAEANYFGTSNLTGTSTRTVLDQVTVAGYATPATTSAVTYKVRFQSATANVTSVFRNATTTAQVYALEISA